MASSILALRRIPAVSTKRIGPSSVSTTVSTVSRVVPGRSCTTARSSPMSRLNSVDLPTFGRPTSATEKMRSLLVGLVLGVVAVLVVGRPARAAGSTSTSRSSTSPAPRPCSALIGERVAEAERQRLPDQALAVGVVDLVDDEQHLAAGQVAHDLGHPAVLLGDPGDGVDHDEHDVGLADGLLALAAHLVVERRRRFGHPAAGVDEREGHALPLGVDLLAVAGDAGLLLHDRDALTRRCG